MGQGRPRDDRVGIGGEVFVVWIDLTEAAGDDGARRICPTARTRSRSGAAPACTEAVEAGRSVAESPSVHGLSWLRSTSAAPSGCPSRSRPGGGHRRHPVRRAPPLALHPSRRRHPTWQRVNLGETGSSTSTGAQESVGAGQRPSLIRDYRLAQPVSDTFCDAIQVVALDPSAPDASAVRQVLPAHAGGGPPVMA
jgi:hypothetical protein